jgi:hypothetical protein
MPKVLNHRDDGLPTDAVYIGRPVPRRRLRGSKWANPFRIGRDGDRYTVIDKFEAWIATQPELLNALPELKGRDLVCWCAPEACHGEVLLRLAANIPQLEKQT